MSVLPSARLAADDPNGFVRNGVSLTRRSRSFAAGKFVVQIKCADACKAKTRRGISPKDATKLGFKNVNQHSEVRDQTTTLDY